jgi:hypothetical protein
LGLIGTYDGFKPEPRRAETMPPFDLLALQRDAGELAARASLLAEQLSAGAAAPFDAVDPVTALRNNIHNRRLRNKLLPAELFSDPAWDMILDLALAALEHRQVSVSSLCLAANVPTTTALRWIKIMLDQGLLVRTDDAADRRRSFVAISEPLLAQVVEFATKRR